MTTTCLEDLHDDLICAIADILPPSDAISFALCNKRLHLLSAARLRLHRDYRAKYSTLYVSNDPTPPAGVWAVRVPLIALYQLSIDPWRAQYVHRVHYNKFYDHDKGHEEPDKDDKKLSDFVLYMSERLPHTDPGWAELTMCAGWDEGIYECFNQYYKDWEEDLEAAGTPKCACSRCMVILLTLLPNVKFLRLEGDPLWNETMGLFRHYVQEVQCKENATLPLSKLRTIKFEWGVSMSSILPLAALPSVRQLYVTGLTELRPEKAMDALYENQLDLFILGIARSRIPTEIIDTIVEKCTNLQRLTIAVPEDDFEFDCGCDVEALANVEGEILGCLDGSENVDAEDDSDSSDDDEDPFDYLTFLALGGQVPDNLLRGKILLGAGYPATGEDGVFDHAVGDPVLPAHLRARGFGLERFVTADQKFDAYVYDFKKEKRYVIQHEIRCCC
jgi:hypothetical protein